LAPKKLAQHQSGFAKGLFVVEARLLASIGCSLKIHRVESALLMESAARRTVPSATSLIASKRTNSNLFK